uniref:C2H2-type domain-containing protein n=1 Tax=Clastoptera arizonana TaxID=38151 RepID=A0A1B6DYI7_9HEMI
MSSNTEQQYKCLCRLNIKYKPIHPQVCLFRKVNCQALDCTWEGTPPNLLNHININHSTNVIASAVNLTFDATKFFDSKKTISIIIKNGCVFWIRKTVNNEYFTLNITTTPIEDMIEIEFNYFISVSKINSILEYKKYYANFTEFKISKQSFLKYVNDENKINLKVSLFSRNDFESKRFICHLCKTVVESPETLVKHVKDSHSYYNEKKKQCYFEIAKPIITAILLDEALLWHYQTTRNYKFNNYLMPFAIIFFLCVPLKSQKELFSKIKVLSENLEITDVVYKHNSNIGDIILPQEKNFPGSNFYYEYEIFEQV